MDVAKNDKKGQALPFVDSFGDFVAFQGPPELAALGISSLHYLLVNLFAPVATLLRELPHPPNVRHPWPPPPPVPARRPRNVEKIREK